MRFINTRRPGRHLSLLLGILFGTSISSGTPTVPAPLGSSGSGTPTVLMEGIQPAGSGAPEVQRDVGIPMRDGVVLRADIYRPAGPGRWPVLVYRTPYGKTAAAESYETHLQAVRRGYAVILQDVRGRYASAGEFDPYRNEGRDGFDTIEWAAEQSWSDGRVGTYGLSYPGAAQWLAAVEGPPHLRAMAPAMTFSSPRHFFYSNGIFDLSWLSWIYQNVAPDRRAQLHLPGITSGEEARRNWPNVADEYRNWRPLRDLPYLRKEAPFYFEWLEHRPEDAWWDWAELRHRYERVDVAVLNLSGWFDEAYGPEGAVTNFNGLRATRVADRSRTELILGPWTHGVKATMSSRAGDMDFGPQAAIDYDVTILDFFDRYLRGDAVDPAPAVRYFVMGENRWREADHWPPRETTEQTLYLRSEHGRLQLSGKTSSDSAAASTSFPADPRHPVVDPHDTFGPHDYQQLAQRADVLTFDTEPLSDDLTVAGAMTAVIHASCDCRDFDLWVRVQDVWPDGRAMNIMSPGNDGLRASYRNPEIGPRPLRPGQVYELHLPNLLTAMRFSKGHRLRIQISASFMPHFSSNLQTGESEIGSSSTRPATITIHHHRGQQSRLILPRLPR